MIYPNQEWEIQQPRLARTPMEQVWGPIATLWGLEILVGFLPLQKIILNIRLIDVVPDFLHCAQRILQKN